MTRQAGSRCGCREGGLHRPTCVCGWVTVQAGRNMSRWPLLKCASHHTSQLLWAHALVCVACHPLCDVHSRKQQQEAQVRECVCVCVCSMSNC